MVAKATAGLVGVDFPIMGHLVLVFRHNTEKESTGKKKEDTEKKNELVNKWKRKLVST